MEVLCLHTTKMTCHPMAHKISKNNNMQIGPCQWSYDTCADRLIQLILQGALFTFCLANPCSFLPAAAVDVPGKLAALRMAPNHPLQTLLTATAEACQSALVKAAESGQPQSLIQALARLQQMRGQAVALPAGMPGAIADTSKALAAIQALAGVAAATDGPGAAAKVEQVGAWAERERAGHRDIHLKLMVLGNGW